MRRAILPFFVVLPVAAFAVGTDDDVVPTPTETTTQCEEGQIWDDKTQGCVSPQESYFDDKTLLDAAREFAYFGQFEHAIAALNAVSDPMEDRVLAMLGFAYRGLGDFETSFKYYDLALEENPDNLLARSYLGQAYVVQGNLAEARVQLTEIRARGGRQTWEEISLREAIKSGQGFRY